MVQKHTLDQLADELEQYIEESAQQLAGAMIEGKVAPFAANVSRAEQLAYWESMFFLPDGSRNEAGRAAVMERYGPDQFERVAKALTRRVLAGESPVHLGAPDVMADPALGAPPLPEPVPAGVAPNLGAPYG